MIATAPGNQSERVMATKRTVVLVEDDPSDQELMLRALQSCETELNVVTFESGRAALDYLQGVGASEVAPPRPSFVILDLHLVGVTGLEVLRTIRTTDPLKRLVVLVVSTDPGEKLTAECYEAGANSVVPKPIDFDAYRFLAQSFEKFWLATAQLPPPPIVRPRAPTSA